MSDAASFVVLRRLAPVFFCSIFFHQCFFVTFVRYVATVVGFLVVSPPFLSESSTRYVGKSQDLVVEDYYRSGRMLLNMASAMGRLVLALPSARNITTVFDFHPIFL